MDLKMENRRKRLEIRKIMQDYNDAKQGLAIEREEQFKPIVEGVKQVKETIDEKQDRLIKKLDENQKALTEDLSFLKELDSPPESPSALEPPPPPKFKKPDPHTGFSQEELDYIQTIGFPTPKVVYNELLDETFDLDKLGVDVNDRIKRANRVKAGLSKNKEKNKDQIEDLVRQADTLKKYLTRINLLAEGADILVTQKGKGFRGAQRKYTQKKRNAYKTSGARGQYGGLLINPLRLLQEMFVEARDPATGAVVFERQGDKGIVDLLTKRFNPKQFNRGNYSQKAIQIFNDLSKLANIPLHKSSGKSKLLDVKGELERFTSRGGAIFSDVKDLTDRLIKLTGGISAGNTSTELRNEAIEILEHLLRKKEISKKQYNAYIKRYFS